jgi:type VI secretion system secreted protein Hcp
MAFDVFLEFPNSGQSPGGAPRIVGESVDKSHPNTIAVTAFSFGIENPTTIGSATGGAGGGKAKFMTLDVSKPVDSTSASHFSALGAGQHFTDASLYVRKAGAAADYLVYKFKMVFVTSIKWSGSNGDDHPQETVDLVYGAMQVAYTPQTPTGALGKQVTGTWNQVTNSTDFTIPGN